MTRMDSSRRVFLRNAALSFATSALHASDTQRRFQYIAVADAIHVSATQRGGWRTVQTVPSRSPTALTWHSSKRILYVANEIDEHEGQPRGTVEAYAVDPNTGCLRLLTRQPLSLSATRPRSLALSPDSRHLVAAAYGGGSYNILSIEPGGGLGKVSGILKEIGSSAHPEHQRSAHPHSLTFDRSGRYLLSTDLGCDQINVFRLVDGALVRHHRWPTAAGSGPGLFAFDSSGTMLRVQSELQKTVRCYSFNPITGHVSDY